MPYIDHSRQEVMFFALRKESKKLGYQAIRRIRLLAPILLIAKCFLSPIAKKS
jgi:hypothetical protein